MKNYQCYLAFIFAIEEINRNPHLLPNTSLGFDLYHVQRGEWDFLSYVFHMLTEMGRIIPNYTCRMENKTVALLTGPSWKTSAHIGRLLNLYKYPQVMDVAVSNQANCVNMQKFQVFSHVKERGPSFFLSKTRQAFG